MARGAAELHRLALEAVNRGDIARARRLLVSAAGLEADGDTHARILGTLAYVHSQTGRLSEAEELCLQALRSPQLSAQTQARLAGQMGALLERAGRFDDAERWLDKGIAALRDDPVARATMLLNRSLLNSRRQRLDDAASDAAEAGGLFDAAGDELLAAMARHNLGYIALMRGDVVAALTEMRAARDVVGDATVAAATADTDRAEALREAGLTREAEELLASTASVFGRHRMPQSRAEVELQLARSQLNHDPAAARRTANAAAKRFRAVGNETWAARADGIRLRSAMAAGGPLPGDAEQVAADLDEHGFSNDAAALRLSQDIWESRHGTRPTSRRPLRVPPAASIEVRLLTYEARAARAAADGKDAAVRRHAAAGLLELRRWLQAFGSLDLQTSVTMHVGGLMIEGLAAAARSGRPDVLFDWSERARLLNHQIVPVRPPEDDALAADLAELRRLRAEDPTGRWRRDPRLTELEDRARERQWSATRGGGIRRRATLAEVQDRLDDGTALLSFVYTGQVLAVVVVGERRAKVVPLPGWATAQKLLPGLRADLDMAASIRTGPMADVVRRSLDERLAALSHVLLDDAVRVSGAERFVLTVPGILEGTPWAMLPALRGRTFTVAVSATRWAGFERDVPVGGRVGIATGPRVARGDEEADAVAAAWTGPSDAPVARLRGADATVDAVTALAGRVDLLHVAAHGRHAVDNPLFSGFELADGTLFGYDLDRVADVPGVVVLSACEAGRSSVRWGEEAVGMTRVWLHAGTQAVVAAPVIVADDAACDLLGAMHGGLASGLGVSAALARASVETGIVAPFQVYGSGF
ncbi:hypothetical protein LK09_02985 [Microbacterium mangrovi]|uniref:CHAT domain-containing protein n=1 Tax=Microbacterium mangrovi TaxID=1348253 RepID=A0A0B2A7U6_9MICO|nr:CHAT domain-containing protein [Microbacterium mangrovi]KHK99589.1 hypothetical protein LK09_02985 [Microbacterium mangrovi]